MTNGHLNHLTFQLFNILTIWSLDHLLYYVAYAPPAPRDYRIPPLRFIPFVYAGLRPGYAVGKAACSQWTIWPI